MGYKISHISEASLAQHLFISLQPDEELFHIKTINKSHWTTHMDGLLIFMNDAHIHKIHFKVPLNERDFVSYQIYRRMRMRERHESGAGLLSLHIIIIIIAHELLKLRQ